MAWAAAIPYIIGAVGSIGGAYLGSKGTDSKSTTSPWPGLQPYLRNLYGGADQLANIPRQFYPGQSYVGALPSEMAGWGGLSGYNSMMYGAPYGGFSQGGGSLTTLQPYQPMYSPANAGFSPPNAGFTAGRAPMSVGQNRDGSVGTARNLLRAGTFGLGGSHLLFGGGNDRKFGGTIDPTTGTVDVSGSGKRNAERDALMTDYLRTGVWSGPGQGRSYSRLRNEADALRQSGWTYNQSAGIEPTGPATASRPGYDPGYGIDSGSLKINPYTATGTAQPAGLGASPFGNVMGAMGGGITGQDTLGRMSGTLGPAATMGLLGNFAQGPQQVSTTGGGFNPFALTPEFGRAGSLDARGTINEMMGGAPQWGTASTVAGASNAGLSGRPDFGSAYGVAGTANQYLNPALSGQPDYSGLQGAIDAANAPILRQFNEEVLPGLNQRATFLGNSTGGIKTLNRVMPEIGERMALNANTLYEGERQRALAAQLTAGQQASSQTYGAGTSALDRALQQQLQASGQTYGAFQNAAQQAAADRGRAVDLVSTGGLSAYGLGMQGAFQNASLGNQYQQNLLDLGRLSGGLASDQSMNAARWGALFPSLAQAGAQPYRDQLAYGGYERSLAEAQLGDSMNRYNFAQQEPYDRYSWLNSILSGSPYVQQTNSGNSALGAAGGAITGAQLASMLYGAYGGGSQLQPGNNLFDTLRLFGQQRTGTPIDPWDSYGEKG